MIDPTERVAIVGLGGIFAGAPDPSRFWENVARGVDATTEVPPGRWAVDPSVAFDPAVAAPDRVYATRGGFVEGFAFDPEGLDLDPDLARRLDPSFHLALHAGRAAWRDTNTEGLDRSRVGVVFGQIVLPTESASALARETLGRWDREAPATEPLNRHAAGLPAGVVARALGLGGGAFTLDAACASSLYALRLAADELLAGRADAMLTGGVSRPDPLYTQMGFSQLRALSPEGKARPFDARGGGLVVGEGAGMFVLKRLSDALRDGDRVYALVAAVGLSNDVDGGLLAPSREGQLRALRSAYGRAGWDPQSVDLIECHATGTPLGDAVEFGSLRALWGDSGWSPGSCVIGSHKANVGHALTAAGAAGLIKVLMALKHDTLPPTPNFSAPADALDYDGGPFRVLTESQPWPRPADGRPRRAAVSGFGFGGINAHALIEEWVPGVRPNVAAPAWVDPERVAEPEAIAVVGLSAYAGPFAGLRAFQERVLGGGDRSGPKVPANDWGVADPGQGPGFHLDELALPVDRFRIPPVELADMLPQQSLLLTAAADAIADAGWADLDRPKTRAGVVIGITLDPNTTNYHVRWTADPADRDDAGPPLTANRTMGALGGLVASRVAREFRLGGPSFTVSSEETSGLRAVDVAARLLRLGEIDTAVVGAVDLTGDPRVAAAARRAGLPALTRSDAAAALVLKRLEDAERDGDRVYAVIRGLGAASGGAIDAPEPDPGLLDASTRLALDEAGADAETVAAFEGSDTERQAAAGNVPTAGGLPNIASLGSVAAEVGHAGAASGLLALVKAAVGLHQGVLKPSKSEPRFWLHDRADGPRRALVGVAGIDGGAHHVLLEAALAAETSRVALERVQPLGANRSALFAVEADDPAGLLAGLDELSRLSEAESGLPVEALARRWFALLESEPSRRLGLAVVAREGHDLAATLAEARRRVEAGGDRRPRPDRADAVHYRGRPLGPAAKVAFVFPGIGNHFAGMGRGLSALWPEVFRKMEGETLRLRSQLAPGAGWDSDEPPAFDDQRAPIMGQVVLGTAVHDVLRSLGVRPDAVVGYSLGESSALFATRTWTERDRMHARLDASPLFRTELAGPCEAARRAWALPPGEPADWVAGIVAAPAEAVRAALADIPRAYLLIANTPRESVVGGRRRAVARLVDALGGPFLPLPVVSTVHCEVARQVEDAYRALHLLETTPPEGVAVYSAGWGRAYEPTRETVAEAVVAQALDTVDFPAVVRAAYDDGVRAFVECGPGNSCSRMIRAILADRPHLARSACVAGEDALDSVLDVLARLVAERIPVDLASLYGRETPAVGLTADVAKPSKTVTVLVGGRPVDRPERSPRVPKPAPLPAAVNGHTPPNLPELDPTVSRPSPAPTAPVSAAPPTPATLPSHPAEVVGDVAVLDAPAGADPIARQLYATELGRLRAHTAYLRSANGLGQTLANHLAFQLAMVEALSAPGGETIATDRPPVTPRTEPAAPVAAGPPPFMDRAACLEYAVGSIGTVLGAAFAGADAFPTRVRLPDEPLMLVDRVVEVEGEPLSMTRGRVVTEHDVLHGGWYLDAGKIPTSLAVESGQADLFLSGYLGIDFKTRGLAVYRLLDAVVTFHRGLPSAGEVIRYDIKIHEFFRQDETYLFRFGFEATVGGEPLLTMRDGCAGFFSEAELASGKGIVRRPIDLRPLPGARPDDWRPLAPMAVESYDDARIDALRRGELAAAFGPAFEGLGLRDPIRLPGGRLSLVNRVPHLDPAGGRYGLGLVRGELDIHPDDWFLTCHFVDDQVMPGTLMYECCLHTLRVYLSRLGWVAEAEGAAWEPVPGVDSRLRCRGQVVGTTKKAVFELSIKEIGYRPEPYAVADALMYADGKAIVEVVDMSVRLTGVTREQVERLWRDRPAAAAAPPALYDRAKILAFAEGKPSEAFGDRYRPFDHDRSIARLPAPPYSFLDRVTEVAGEPWVMAAGAGAVADYDVPADAWYFDANRQERMPFAVLLEASLQVCGWLAAYMGSALTDDQDLKFRNLGGTATVLTDVTRRTGTLTTRATTTKVVRSGGMIIQHFAFETSAGPVPVYRGETYFGFFRKEALANQVGIRDAATLEPTPEELARARSFDYPRGAPFPDDRFRMIDRVEAFVADGGPAGLGAVVGTWDVDPSAWFFKAHFVGDPVCPGSLGLESFLQLLKVWASERWGAAEFEAVGLGDPHAWVYRGQVLPTDRRVTTRAVVTEVDDARRWLKADGRFEVDGRLIYQMDGFTLRAV